MTPKRPLKKMRVLALMHEDLVPPESIDGYSEKEFTPWKTEYDVASTLRASGHEVRPLGVVDELTQEGGDPGGDPPGG